MNPRPIRVLILSPRYPTSGREAMGRAARETVQPRFSMKLIASQYLELYRRLASAGAS
ncbi:MAG TPA: hypothetical protein VFW45_15545 [Candidatus Polarisedimenticolia bacterium]|nr:hypothetical protein [Candidatus Polarisedimenticolia bacterium]